MRLKAASSIGIADGMQPHHANHGIGFVEGAVGVNPQVVLLAPVAGAKRGRAVIAGAGVDTVEHDHSS